MSLGDQIHAIEERFGATVVRSGALGEREELRRLETGWADIDAAMGGGLAIAALHEWFGVASGRRFAAGRAEDARREVWRPPLLPLVHLVKRAMNRGSFPPRVAWIGRRCFPYGGVLVGAGGDERLLERSFFVTAEGPVDRLWAVELALRCPAVGLVIADGSAFDMTATRRVQLAARARQIPALLVRPPWETRELSAAQTRWLLRWAERSREGSGPDAEETDEESNPPRSRWSAELLRCKGRSAGWVPAEDSGPCAWTLEWDRDQSVVRVFPALVRPVGDARASANDRLRRQA